MNHQDGDFDHSPSACYYENLTNELSSSKFPLGILHKRNDAKNENKNYICFSTFNKKSNTEVQNQETVSIRDNNFKNDNTFYKNELVKNLQYEVNGC